MVVGYRRVPDIARNMSEAEPATAEDSFLEQSINHLAEKGPHYEWQSTLLL